MLDEEWYDCWRCRPDDPRGVSNAGALFKSAAELKAEVSPHVDTSYAPHFDICSVNATRTSAEKWSGLRARMESTIRVLAAAHPGQTLLFVTHGGPIEAVLPALDPRLSRRVRVNYTSLSVFLPDAAAPAGFTCTVHSDASHIENIDPDVEDAVPGK